MFNKFLSLFDKVLRRYTPDPFLFAVILTVVLFILCLLFTDSNLLDAVKYWGDGFWGLVPFTLQMSMILIGGYMVALSPVVQRILFYCSGNVKNSNQAVVMVSIVSVIGCYLNWGLGLVIGGVLCRHIIYNLPNVNFRLLVASAYSGFLVWHGGLSGSIPLTIATEGNFAESIIGRVIPVGETLFSLFNIIVVTGLVVMLPVINYYLSTKSVKNNSSATLNFNSNEDFPLSSKKESGITQNVTPAEKLETSSILSLIIGMLGVSYILMQKYLGLLSFNLNTINFMFIFSGIILNKNLKSVINVVSEASGKIGPILLQFPFYAGIMGLITSSGLVNLISNMFVNISSHHTFPLFAFYSAGLVNIFIPSGGGQWAVQAPIVISAAQELGVNISLVSMAVAWGDAWTNMLQPFWALPLLAIVGLHLRDIIGYCLVYFLFSGVFITTVLLVLS